MAISRILAAVIMAALISAASSGLSNAEEPVIKESDQEWNFRVYLDGNEIGYHRYQLTELGGIQRLFTEADFRVKFLFFTAYKYQHINTEIWNGDCLQKIDAWTDANGENFSVLGQQRPDGFELQANATNNTVDGCVKTFAYWNPEFIDEASLLNSQTGKLMPINVEPLEDEELTIRGQRLNALRYRLVAEDIDLELWYTNDKNWLGLQSTTKDGHTIRYELI